MSTLPATEPGICLLGRNLIGCLGQLPAPQAHMVQSSGYYAGGGIVGDIVADSAPGTMWDKTWGSQ